MITYVSSDSVKGCVSTVSSIVFVSNSSVIDCVSIGSVNGCVSNGWLCFY